MAKYHVDKNNPNVIRLNPLISSEDESSTKQIKQIEDAITMIFTDYKPPRNYWEEFFPSQE